MRIKLENPQDRFVTIENDGKIRLPFEASKHINTLCL